MYTYSFTLYQCLISLFPFPLIAANDDHEIAHKAALAAAIKTRSVRRSFSDRKQKAKARDEKRNLFLDTMALRINLERRDARDIDFHGQRPREPPPPPPTATSTPIKEVTSSTEDQPERPPRQRKSSQISIGETSITSSSSSGDSQQQLMSEDSHYEAFNFQALETSRKNARNAEYLKKEVNLRAPANRIVVPVAPIMRATTTKESATVHRLEVKHADPVASDSNYETNNNFKKTSILISGDDCYSTVNVNDDTSLYQASVVVNDSCGSVHSSSSASNTVTINVGGSNVTVSNLKSSRRNSSKSVVPITQPDPPVSNGKTLISVDYNDNSHSWRNSELSHHEQELDKLLRNPVEAVRLNLVPHVCGKVDEESLCPTNSSNNNTTTTTITAADAATTTTPSDVVKRKAIQSSDLEALSKKLQRNSFIAKLLEDPTLGHLAEGLDNDIIAKLIESSLIRLKENRSVVSCEKAADTKGSTVEDEGMAKLIDLSLHKIQEERRQQMEYRKAVPQDESSDRDAISNGGGSISSGTSYSSTNYETFDFDNHPDSDCYQSCSSELTTEEDGNSARSKFYQMLVDATLSEIEISTNLDDDQHHHYESIRITNNNGNVDPIYEEISEIPPPLPLSLPPAMLAAPPITGDSDLDKKHSRSMFEGASKYDILSYLVDAKERGVVPEESYTYNFSNTSSDIIHEEDQNEVTDENEEPTVDSLLKQHHKRQNSAGSDDTVVSLETKEKLALQQQQRKSSTDIERNDSGVGSETSKSSRNKFLNVPPPGSVLDKNSPIHLCEDCDGPVETQVTESGVMYAPLVCRKCGKKRAERKEIITEIVETEEKYGRDLQIILEEFYQPMLVAGLLTQDQLSAIFLNTEELLENNQQLAERMRDALDIASEQGDDDLLTVNVGKLFLDAAPMLHAFETYCVGQAAASLLLANLEKEKELLRIFLRVSQMENSVLRRMNLNSFLMVS